MQSAQFIYMAIFFGTIGESVSCISKHPRRGCRRGSLNLVQPDNQANCQLT